METVAVARNAMATRFEILLHGEKPVSLRAAAEEALNEIERLEARLSLYRPGSEIHQLNTRAAHEPVRVSPEVFRLLQHARNLSAETAGAFDITVAPLVRAWGFMGGTGSVPDDDQLAEARARVGMHLVELSDATSTVRFARPGVMLDLGAIGKGYALERAAEILIEAGVTSGLLHGGTSTVHAIGAPPGAEAWNAAIQNPQQDQAVTGSVGISSEAGSTSADVLATVTLRNEALSVSAPSGKFFTAGGQVLGHVLDPRSGRPCGGAAVAAVVLESATETDALSTALLVLGVEGHDKIAALRPGMRTVLAEHEPGGDRLRLHARGIPLRSGG